MTEQRHACKCPQCCNGSITCLRYAINNRHSIKSLFTQRLNSQLTLCDLGSLTDYRSHSNCMLVVLYVISLILNAGQLYITLCDVSVMEMLQYN